MDSQERKGSRTLLASVLLSSPGPLVLGLGLTVGRSSTQLADFIRRTAELAALFAAWLVYKRTHGKEALSPERVHRLERGGNLFTGAIMCFSGLAMLLLTVFAGSRDKGNVLPALIIAVLGAATNLFFWRRYTTLSRAEGNEILRVQARLYGAKSLVDLAVSTALLAILAAPASPVSARLDTAGSLLVSLYMIYCGVKTIREQAGNSGADI